MRNILIFISLMASYNIACAAGDNSKNAITMFNFSSFLQWQDSDFENEYSDINICLIGNKDLANKMAFFDEVKVRDRKLQIVSVNKQTELNSNCHLMYTNNKETLTDLLATQKVNKVTSLDNKNFEFYLISNKESLFDENNSLNDLKKLLKDYVVIEPLSA